MQMHIFSGIRLFSIECFMQESMCFHLSMQKYAKLPHQTCLFFHSDKIFLTGKYRSRIARQQ